MFHVEEMLVRDGVNFSKFNVWSKVRALCGIDLIPPRLIDVIAFIIPISKGKTIYVWSKVRALCGIDLIPPRLIDVIAFIVPISKGKTITLYPDQIVQVILSMVLLKLVTFKFKKMFTRPCLLLDQWKILRYCIIHDGSSRPTPIPKPPSSCNEPQNENYPLAHSNQSSPQPHLPSLIDAYIATILQPQSPPPPQGREGSKRIRRNHKGKGKEKGKNKLAYASKPKILPPPKREHPLKDSAYHHYKEVGYWRRNYSSYQDEL
nr:zinc finger, CCHC-type [Tanacetum cinerariifolium]